MPPAILIVREADLKSCFQVENGSVDSRCQACDISKPGSPALHPGKKNPIFWQSEIASPIVLSASNGDERR